MQNSLKKQDSNKLPSIETIELLEQLISFRTVSRDSNLGLIEWSRDYLRGLGAETRLTFDKHHRKANLFATLGGGKKPGIVFSGHTDVVPVDGQEWTSDPFQMRIDDGKAYGRGTCDMKGFIAVCLSKAPDLIVVDGDAPVHFAFSYDEELGCLGVRGLLADLQKQGIKPGGCIVGEPTSMVPVIAHKGKRAYRCCVGGHPSHSSRPDDGVNAIEFASDLIGFIRKRAQGLRHGLPNDTAFDVPFSSLVTTMINGGNAVNTIPDQCEFVFEYRFLPGVDPDEVISELERYARNVLLPQMNCGLGTGSFRLEMLSGYPALSAQPSDSVVQLAMRLLGSEHAAKVAFGTEGGLFSAAGIPSLVCGPGDIAQAHKPDEFVTLHQLARCEAFVASYARGFQQGYSAN